MSQAVLSPPRALLLRDIGLSTSGEARVILQRWVEVVEHYHRPATRQTPSIEQTFQELAAIPAKPPSPVITGCAALALRKL